MSIDISDFPTAMLQRFATSNNLMPTQSNAEIILRKALVFKELLLFNEFSQEIYISRPVPNEFRSLVTKKHPEPRAISDEERSQIQTALEQCGMFTISQATTNYAIEIVARDRTFHPVKQEMESEPWDQIPRLDGFFSTYCGSEDTLYTQTVGRTLFLAIVARTYEPGCKFDSLVVLQGAQGIMKSTLCASLAIRPEWFCDDPGAINSKDGSLALGGKIIVELAELASFNRKEHEEIKRFISRQTEQFRPPYKRSVILRPRTCVMIGTTNSDEFLNDATGNRRYFPVSIVSFKKEEFEQNRKQIYAEALFRYKAKEQYWFSTEFENKLGDKEHDRFVSHDAWSEPLAEHMRGRSSVTYGMLYEKLDIPIKDQNNKTQARIRNEMMRLGFRIARCGGITYWINAKKETNPQRLWKAGLGPKPE